LLACPILGYGKGIQHTYPDKTLLKHLKINHMKKTNYLLLLSITFMLMTASCGKDGAVGPAGQTGPQGPAGIAGTAGTAGTSGAKGATGVTGVTGATGTANVIYSDWIKPVSYKKDTVFGTYNFYYDIAASKITQAILDNGSVIVYGKLDGYVSSIWPTNQVSALPIEITYMDGATADIDSWSDYCTVGNIRINLASSLNAYGSISNAHQFRYVIIPGGVHTLGSINPKNYNQVKQALHLKD
jgi:hypothetical protein